jgi:ADP-L-glycero-D-manno-heptose 6-epimerase
MVWSIHHLLPANGIYNVGTGQAREFRDLGLAAIHAINDDAKLEYVDMPIDLREKYQYFTEADMTKWKSAGLALPATSLENGIQDYIQHYLNPGNFY